MQTGPLFYIILFGIEFAVFSRRAYFTHPILPSYLILAELFRHRGAIVLRHKMRAPYAFRSANAFCRQSHTLAGRLELAHRIDLNAGVSTSALSYSSPCQKAGEQAAPAFSSQFVSLFVLGGNRGTHCAYSSMRGDRLPLRQNETELD